MPRTRRATAPVHRLSIISNRDPEYHGVAAGNGIDVLLLLIEHEIIDAERKSRIRLGGPIEQRMCRPQVHLFPIGRDFPNSGVREVRHVHVAARIDRNIVGITKWPTLRFCGQGRYLSGLSVDLINARLGHRRVSASGVERICQVLPKVMFRVARVCDVNVARLIKIESDQVSLSAFYLGRHPRDVIVAAIILDHDDFANMH